MVHHRVGSRAALGQQLNQGEALEGVLTAAMAGYALAKKRFNGRAILFSLIVCAMSPRRF